MKKNIPRVLTPQEYSDIEEIARMASVSENLDFTTCYTVTLLYYLAQFGGLDESQIPFKYYDTINLLHKKPISSYIHYRMDIIDSTNIIAKAIKTAEIALNGGDDPRCPW